MLLDVDAAPVRHLGAREYQLALAMVGGLTRPAACWRAWWRWPGAGSLGPTQPGSYVAATAGLAAGVIAWVAMLGGYDMRLIGLGSEEFRRVLNSAMSLTAAIADRVLRRQGSTLPADTSDRPSGPGGS